jgi:hypothetical protein
MSRGQGHGGLAVPAQRCADGWEFSAAATAAGAQGIFLPLSIAMSRRMFQRRQPEELAQEQLVDAAFGRYLEWLAECDAVNAAYGAWSSAARSRRALPFAAYRAALDREERAAIVYHSAIDQVEQLFDGGARLTGVWPEVTRA